VPEQLLARVRAAIDRATAAAADATSPEVIFEVISGGPSDPT
jgi:hypothetical protein